MFLLERLIEISVFRRLMGWLNGFGNYWVAVNDRVAQYSCKRLCGMREIILLKLHVDRLARAVQVTT